MIRETMISVNASSEGILRNNFALEFRVHQEKSLEKLFGENSY